MSELPDSIKRIDVLRLEKAMQKPCNCFTHKYLVDSQNRLVYCQDCGAIVDSFEALKNLAWYYQGLGEQVEYLLKQRQDIVNWKPWLIVFRSLESQYRSGKALPCCPECNKPFYFEKINSWTSRELHEKRKAKEKAGESEVK